MRARARLVTAVGVDGGGRPVTQVAGLRSEVPLVLRPTLPPADPPYPAWEEAMRGGCTVALVAGAAGPLGGDELRLEVVVGAGSALTLTEVGATLLLPGPRGAESRLTVEVVVEAAGDVVEALIDRLGSSGVHAENWTESVTFSCKACSLGRVDYDSSEHAHHGTTAGDGTASIGCSGNPVLVEEVVRAWATTQDATVISVEDIA